MPFWVGGTGNITDAANHWAATTGGAPGAGNLPGPASDAIFDANSGANAVITVDGSFSCKNFDMSACAATPTLAGSATLNILGSFTLKAGMTRTFTGSITFNATTTGQAINTNGVALSSGLTFSGSGGGWTLAAALNIGTGSITHSAGTINYAGFSVNCAGFNHSSGTPTITLGASTVTCSQWSILVGATLSAASSTINTTSTFNGAGKTYGTVVATSNNAINGLSGNNTFANLTLAPAVGTNRSSGFSLSGDQVVTGTFKYAGFSQTSRVQIVSNVPGTTRTITAAAIDAASDFVIFSDIAGAGAAAPFATGTQIGNALGNSGITFTPSATQTATGTASFTWSTHGWTTRVPLPQDDVNIPNAFVAGRTITVDMPHIGRNITFTCTGSPVYTPSTPVTITGSLALAAGMTSTSNQALHLAGRGTHTLTCAGTNFIMPTFFDGPGATWNLQDALNLQTSNSIAMSVSLGSGVLNTNDFAVTLNCTTTSVIAFRMNSGTLNMGNSTFVLPSVGRWDYVGGTINAGTSTIKYTDNSATAKSFAGNGQTYYNVWFNSSGAGAFQIVGSSTFNQFKIDAGCAVQFTAGTTTTAADWQLPAGSSIDSITAAQHTLAFSQNPGHVSLDFLTIAHSNATPAKWWFAGTHSVDGGNNSGWVFGDYQGMTANAHVIATVTPTLISSILVEFIPGSSLFTAAMQALKPDPNFVVADDRDFSVDAPGRGFHVEAPGRTFTVSTR